MALIEYNFMFKNGKTTTFVQGIRNNLNDTERKTLIEEAQQRVTKLMSEDIVATFDGGFWNAQFCVHTKDISAVAIYYRSM